MGQLSCLNSLKNIGFSACKKLPQQINGFFTTPPGFSLTAAQAVDPAEWQAALLAAKGVRIYLFPRGVGFENISEAAVYEENSLADIAVRDGRYKFRISFQENFQLHKNMFSHKNFQGRVILWDDNGNLTLTSDDGGATLKGLTISLLNPEKLTFNDGSVASKTPVYLSLADNLEIDKRGCMVDGSFVNSLIRLTTVNLLVASATATDINVSVSSDLDSEPILGLIAADFILLDGGGVAQTIVSSVDNGDGTYILSGVGLVSGTLTLVSAATLSVPGFESAGAVTVTI